MEVNMTKYEKLWAAYKAGAKSFSEYRDEALEFISKFIIGFCKYLDCPNDRVLLFPPNQEIDYSRTFTIVGATIYDDDGYWSVNMMLRVARPDAELTGMLTSGREAGYIFALRFVRKEGKYLLRKLDGSHIEFEIDSDEDRLSYYEKLFKIVKDNLEDGREVDPKSDAIHRIGF
jgi:hypothetical protein